MLTASADLVALARSQITLLNQSLGAGSSAMYLTQELNSDTAPNLIEVVSFPENSSVSLDYTLALPPSDRQALVRSGRLVIPLLYDQQILGFLITARPDREWNETEQSQIQQVANTLAIACGIELRHQWLEMAYRAQQLQQQSFIASLLHQLRNPLTAIRTFSQLIRRRLRPDDPNQTLVTGILRETSHLQELLQTADQPQLGSGSPLLLTGSLELSAIDLNQFLEPLLASAQAIAQAHHLQLITHLPPHLPPVWANHQALREIITNLLDNAIKYTPAPGTITLTATAHPPTLDLQVQDSGCGIPAQDLDQIFQRHYRGQQAGSQIQGNGLGLAIVKDLSEQIHAQIQVTSLPHQGSTFTLQLQLAPPKDARLN
ncbi:MAG: GAF domain-containing sensor histidine kinase [Pseudanabaenaceae cyanobacterium bins.68]|nr:GAF domain-containing sensor histidine kinase [Pseudanabaenaceae cyanobacterium bins.68]